MNEATPTTRIYPRDAVAAALQKISAQGLWLLLSIDHYSWRAEHDAIRVLLEGRPSEEHDHFTEHAPLSALAHLFALVDKLWRLVCAIRAHRSGREFLNSENGYLAGGYKLHAKLRELREITPEQWRDLLAVPADATIREYLGSVDDEEIERRVAFAADLPTLIATNMTELAQYVERGAAETGPREETYSLRDLDDKHRHGGPVVYHDCSPTDAGWIDVAPIEGVDISDTVGLVAMPPDARGAAYITLVKHDREMTEGVVNASAVLAGLVRRLVRAHLNALAPGLVDPLAGGRRLRAMSRAAWTRA